MSQKSMEETIVKMAIEGATNGEIARAIGLEVKIVAAITGHYRNLIMAKRYERSGRRPDGTPMLKRQGTQL